jgi:hypothetical protein
VVDDDTVLVELVVVVSALIVVVVVVPGTTVVEVVGLLNRRQPLDVPAGSRSGHEPDQAPTAGAQHHRHDQHRPPSINAEPHLCPRARLRIR